MKYFYLFIISIVLFSCNREGTGGENTIVVSPKYKGKIIKNSTVFVRFGATDFPGSASTDYDLNVKADTSGTVSILNLRKGDYFIYATAFDSINASIVQGGAHIHLSSKSGQTKTDIEVAP